MGNRLRAKHSKRRMDRAAAYKRGEAPSDHSTHKVVLARSRKAKLKKANRMT